MKKKMRGSGSSKPIKMTDAELSKKLGYYQTMSYIWFLGKGIWPGYPHPGNAH